MSFLNLPSEQNSRSSPQQFILFYDSSVWVLVLVGEPWNLYIVWNSFVKFYSLITLDKYFIYTHVFIFIYLIFWWGDKIIITFSFLQNCGSCKHIELTGKLIWGILFVFFLKRRKRKSHLLYKYMLTYTRGTWIFGSRSLHLLLIHISKTCPKVSEVCVVSNSILRCLHIFVSIFTSLNSWGPFLPSWDCNGCTAEQPLQLFRLWLDPP